MRENISYLYTFNTNTIMKKILLVLILIILLIGVITFWFVGMKDQKTIYEDRFNESSSIDFQNQSRPLYSDYNLTEADIAEEDDEMSLDAEWDQSPILADYKARFWGAFPMLREGVADSIAEKYAELKIIEDSQYEQLADTAKFGGLTAIKRHIDEEFKYYGPASWVYTPSFSTYAGYEDYIVDRDTTSVQILPFEVRELALGSNMSEKNWFFSTWTYLSLNRMKFDFSAMYQQNKSWIHFLLSKDDYDKYVGNNVDLLIDIFLDMNSNLPMVEVLAEEMYRHEQLFRYSDSNYNPTLDENEGFEENFIALISPDLRDRIDSDYYAVYLYSFWLRRYYENNLENIFSLLGEIQFDYSTMESEEEEEKGGEY